MKRKKYFFIMTVMLTVVFCTGCRGGKMKERVTNPGVLTQRTVRQMEKQMQNTISETSDVVGDEIRQETITMIGDSIMLGASEELLEIIPGCIIDAKKSRQVEEGIEIVKNLDEQGKLGNTVIIALGTNGIFTDETAEQILDCLGEERNIYWVTAYGKNLSWKDEVNEKIRQIAEEHANIFILDWENVADKHDEWFCEDGIHLNADGQAGYAEFISLQIFS